MKRSEVSKGLDALKIPRWEKAQIFDILERAGATWDPETPELPGRVEVGDNGDGTDVLVPEGMSWGDTTRKRDLALTQEAARRYNAVGSLLEYLETYGDEVHGVGGVTEDQKRLLAILLRRALDEEGVTR